MAIPGADERWENWMQFIQSRLIPTFTPVGFKKMKTPPGIQERFAEALADDLKDEAWDSLSSEEGVGDAIYNTNGNAPKFIRWKPLFHKIHQELLPLHEKWAGKYIMKTLLNFVLG